MKVQITRNELYPFYEVAEEIDQEWIHFEPVIEVKPSTLERWKRVMKEFHQLQIELEKRST